MPTLEQAYAECRRITKENAKNFYYSFIALPREKRLAIHAIYSFCRLCDDAADEPGLSIEERLRRLTAIRLSLDTLSEPAADNPVFMALSDAASRYAIPVTYFLDIVSGVEMDLSVTRYNTFDGLKEYCYRVASAVGLTCIEVYGYTDPKARDYAVDLGLAMQLTNIIRDVKEDLERDRIYIPLDEIERFGYSEAALKEGVVNDAFSRLMAYQAARARQYFQSGLKLLPYLSARSRTSPALLAALYQRILDKIEAGGFHVFDGRTGLSGREKYLLTLWTWLKCFLPTTGTPS